MRLMLNPLTVIGFLPVDDDQSGVESAAVGSCSRSAGNESLFAEQIKHDRPEKTMRGFATRAGDVAEFMARGIIRSNPPLRRGAGFESGPRQQVRAAGAIPDDPKTEAFV